MTRRDDGNRREGRGTPMGVVSPILSSARSVLGRAKLGAALAAMFFGTACSSSTSDTSGPRSSGGATSSSGGATSTSGGAGSNSGGTSGAHSGGTTSGGGTHSGGATSSGGASASGGVSGNGDSGIDSGDAPNNLCGGVPCLSTRCAGIGCGPAVCCPSASGPVCIHGATKCPASDAGARRESLACWSQSGSGDFAKGCAKASDCFVAQHYSGCCHIEAVGLNASDQTAFNAFEQQTCGGAPPCGCCCDQVSTEDGTSAASGGSITVDCIGGLCATRSP